MGIRRALLFNSAIAVGLTASAQDALSLCLGFAHRYAETMLALPAPERKLRMETDNVLLHMGTLETLSQLSIPQRSDVDARIDENDKRYCLELKAAGKSAVVEFPAQCQLLLGKNLKQLEDEWLEQVRLPKQYTTDTLLLTSPTDGVVSRGLPYYIKEINRSLYYKDGQLVFQPEYITESVLNLLLVPALDLDVTVQMMLRLYGRKTQDVTVKLSQFLAMLEAQGYTLYAGIQRQETDHVRASLFAVNKVLRCNHVFEMTIPNATITSRQGTIKSVGTLFVPMHNVQALFGENE